MINRAVSRVLVEAGLERGLTQGNHPGVPGYIRPKTLINMVADQRASEARAAIQPSSIDASEAGPSNWQPNVTSTPKKVKRSGRKRRRAASPSGSSSSDDETIQLNHHRQQLRNMLPSSQDSVSSDSFNDVELSINAHESTEEFVDGAGASASINDSNIAAENANRQTAMNELLSHEYDDDLPRNHLPSINSKLAATITNWCRNVPSREKIKDSFKCSLLPDNVEGLQPVKINEVLYMRLPFSVKLNDQRLRGINSFFARGLGPIVSVMDSLIKLETSLPETKNVSVQQEARSLTLDKTVYDIQHLRRLLATGVKLLCFGHSACLQKRKTNLRPSLDQRYQYLTKPGNTVTTELLGPNLEQKISDSNKLMEAARRISVRKPFFNKQVFNSAVFNSGMRSGYKPRFQNRGNYRANSTRSRPFSSGSRRQSGFRNNFQRRPFQQAQAHSSTPSWYNRRNKKHS